MDIAKWIEQGVDIALLVFGALGLQGGHILAILLSLFVCWGSTQALKITFGLDGRVVTVIAFVIAFFVAFTVSPPKGLVLDWANLWVSVATGLAGPFAYKWLKSIAEKRGWALAKAMEAAEAKSTLNVRRKL